MHNVNAACLPVTDDIAGRARRMTAEHCSEEWRVIEVSLWRVIEVSLHRMRLDDVVARARLAI
jgi:hypothetical protein